MPSNGATWPWTDRVPLDLGTVCLARTRAGVAQARAGTAAPTASRPSCRGPGSAPWEPPRFLSEEGAARPGLLRCTPRKLGIEARGPGPCGAGRPPAVGAEVRPAAETCTWPRLPTPSPCLCFCPLHRFVIAHNLKKSSVFFRTKSCHLHVYLVQHGLLSSFVNRSPCWAQPPPSSLPELLRSTRWGGMLSPPCPGPCARPTGPSAAGPGAAAGTCVDTCRASWLFCGAAGG